MYGRIQNIEVSDSQAKSSEHCSPMLLMIHFLMEYFLQQDMDVTSMGLPIHWSNIMRVSDGKYVEVNIVWIIKTEYGKIIHPISIQKDME